MSVIILFGIGMMIAAGSVFLYKSKKPVPLDEQIWVGM